MTPQGLARETLAAQASGEADPRVTLRQGIDHCSGDMFRNWLP